MFLILFCQLTRCALLQLCTMETQSSYKVLNKANHKRAAHIDFFRGFDNPFWGVATTVNCTRAYQYCKAYQVSFFYYYLYQSLRAVNAVAELRTRLIGEDVVEFDQVGGSITVLRPDETFGFAYFDFHESFTLFTKAAKARIDAAKYERGLFSDPAMPQVVHYSVLRDIPFTGIQHAQHFCIGDSIPKITFGKYSENSQAQLPISIHAHHALCDGVHVGKFLARFQQFLEQ